MRRVILLLAGAVMLLAATTLPTFRAGAQQTVVTDDNVDEAITNAKTAADHEAIAAYYDKEAAEDEEKAKIHHAQHKIYDRFHMKTATDMGPHCDALAKNFERAAEQDKALAAGHREMAKKTAGH